MMKDLIEIDTLLGTREQTNECAKQVDKYEVGDRIKRIRYELGFTQKELALRLKTSSVNISHWENGKHLPNNKRLNEIAFYGQISVDELLYGKFCFWNCKSEKISTCGIEKNTWRKFVSEDFGYCPYCGRDLIIEVNK